MAMESKNTVVPQTILQIMEQFVAAMRADPDIPDDAISRLEILLRKGAVPRPDDINAALFESQEDDER